LGRFADPIRDKSGPPGHRRDSSQHPGWESGRDLFPTLDVYESFCVYQSALLAEFDPLSAEYRFEIVDATLDERQIFDGLQSGILRVPESDSPKNGDHLLARPSALPLTREWVKYERTTFQEAFSAALNKNVLPGGTASSVAQGRFTSGNGNGHRT
jgi:hypothetical protein